MRLYRCQTYDNVATMERAIGNKNKKQCEVLLKNVPSDDAMPTFVASEK